MLQYHFQLLDDIIFYYEDTMMYLFPFIVEHLDYFQFFILLQIQKQTILKMHL